MINPFNWHFNISLAAGLMSSYIFCFTISSFGSQRWFGKSGCSSSLLSFDGLSLRFCGKISFPKLQSHLFHCWELSLVLNFIHLRLWLWCWYFGRSWFGWSFQVLPCELVKALGSSHAILLSSQITQYTGETKRYKKSVGRDDFKLMFRFDSSKGSGITSNHQVIIR